VLAGVKFVNGIGYGPLPKELRGKRNVTAAPKKVQARFRSGKMKYAEVGRHIIIAGCIIVLRYVVVRGYAEHRVQHSEGIS
jgi:hypothetical protein